MEKSWIIAVITIGAFVSVESLQCYTCVDCPASTLTDANLVTCGVIETTNTSTTAAVNPSTTPSNAAPADPNTTLSTAAPLEPNTTLSTTAAVNQSTTPSTAAPGHSSTVPSTAAHVHPNTTPSTAASVDPNTTLSTTTPVNSSNTPSTSAPVASGIDGAESEPYWSNYEKDPTRPHVLRVRRNIVSETKLDSGCTCYGTRCACNKKADVLNAIQFVDVTYVCTKATVKGPNGTDIIIRGCTEPRADTKTVCEYLQKEANATDCHTCTSDKCNGANTMQYSLVALLIVLTSIITNKNQC